MIKIELSKKQRERIMESIEQEGIGVLKFKAGRYEVCDMVDLVVMPDSTHLRTLGSDKSYHEIITLGKYLQDRTGPVKEKSLLQKLLSWGE